MGALEVDVSGHAGSFAIEARFAAASGVTGLVGPSGAGKTTVLKMIAGLIAPDSGTIRLGSQVFFAKNTGVNLPPEQRGVGMVFQDARLFPHLSVTGNLLYGARARKLPLDQTAVEEITQLLGIEGLLHRYPAKLSGGERQRVAIGRALLSQPELLILDEPLTSVDRERRGVILPFILQHCRAKRISIILVSHEHPDILRHCDSVVEIKDGKTGAFGPVGDFISTLMKP
jgi:molybdate transport system ATP-binding protein